MLRIVRTFGDWLDAIDLGGLICLLSGAAIVGVTVLAPAWLDIRQMRYEQTVLEREAVMLDMSRENYEQFVAAIEKDDPILLTRLAWHHLRLKPEGTQSFARGDWSDGISARPEQWVRPVAGRIPVTHPVEPVPDTRLVRLVLGSARPWVLAFGGWVMLIGLIVTPRRRVRTRAGAVTAVSS